MLCVATAHYGYMDSIAWTDTLVSAYDANVYDTMGHVRAKCKV